MVEYPIVSPNSIFAVDSRCRAGQGALHSGVVYAQTTETDEKEKDEHESWEKDL